MKLLLDIGNSRVKWAWLAGGKFVDSAVVTHRDRPLDRVLGELRRVPRHSPMQIVVASVANAVFTTSVVDAFAAGTPAEVVMAKSEGTALGVRNGYRQPTQLGVDRWMGLLATRAFARDAACIVQAGTAVTIDIIAPDGRHQGGLIVPGPELMIATLVSDTDRLGSAAGEIPAGPAACGLALDTASAIGLGPLAALRSLIASCAMDAAERYGPTTIVLTGGSAPALLAGLPASAMHRPLLVLEGLALRYAGVREIADLASPAGT